MPSERRKKPYGAKFEKAMMAHAREQGVKGYGIAILGVLVRYRNYETGQTRPGNAVISSETGATRNTIAKHLQQLRDAGLIVPVAYLQGGAGRTTVYGFGLPAWSGYAEQNPPKIWTKPPQNLDKTPPKNGGPTERTIRTGEKAGAGRPDGDKVRADMSEAQALSYVVASGRKPKGWTFADAKAEARRICSEMEHGADVVAPWGEPVAVERCVGEQN